MVLLWSKSHGDNWLIVWFIIYRPYIFSEHLSTHSNGKQYRFIYFSYLLSPESSYILTEHEMRCPYNKEQYADSSSKSNGSITSCYSRQMSGLEGGIKVLQRSPKQSRAKLTSRIVNVRLLLFCNLCVQFTGRRIKSNIYSSGLCNFG